MHVALEAGALLRSDDAGGNWRDRVPSGPKNTHSLAVHPQDPTRLHSAAGDGYFESVDDRDSWRRIVDGLEHQYCWSIAVSIAHPTTLFALSFEERIRSAFQRVNQPGSQAAAEHVLDMAIVEEG